MNRYYMNKIDNPIPTQIRHPSTSSSVPTTPPTPNPFGFKSGEELYYLKPVMAWGRRLKDERHRVTYIGRSEYGPHDVKARVKFQKDGSVERVSYNRLDRIS